MNLLIQYSPHRNNCIAVNFRQNRRGNPSDFPREGTAVTPQRVLREVRGLPLTHTSFLFEFL